MNNLGNGDQMCQFLWNREQQIRYLNKQPPPKKKKIKNQYYQLIGIQGFSSLTTPPRSRLWKCGKAFHEQELQKKVITNRLGPSSERVSQSPTNQDTAFGWLRQSSP